MAMRIAILADIHSNLEAFQAVLRHAEASNTIDRVWCLGDVVGYGPDPMACIDLLRCYQHHMVMGNHDAAASGDMDTSEFNVAAARAAAWTMAQLTDDARAYLRGLPPSLKDADFTLVHGSLYAPIWEYLLSGEQARAQLDLQETPYSLVGHSHIPFVARERAKGSPILEYLEDGQSVELGRGRLILNPGGVGQPRDGDPRASYALCDVEARTITLHRLQYDIAETQRKMRAADLPSWLIERLSVGR
jgi:predicted phosphodiesterase